MEKESTLLAIRIDKDLKNAFELVAEDLDLTVSQMIRKYIRFEVDRHTKENAQKPLFKAIEPTKAKTDTKASPEPKKAPMGSKNALLDMFKGK